jgi:DNA processing protein
MKEMRRGDGEYPSALDDLLEPPERLFALGDTSILGLASRRLVAIVGTREATPYGLKIARVLATAFVEAGLGVVSGLARGIDSAAHRAAIEAGGRTVAVLGTGADVPYPVGHRALHAEIVDKGLVLSECEPGALAAPGCFPKRNRIIAGLAHVTIVVEAPFKSGAINTATHAMNSGRVVAAVPGPIDSPRSAGCNLLIRDGAQLIGTVDDALGLYGIARRRRPLEGAPVLGSLETTVWDALASGPADIDTLSGRAGLPVRQVLEGIARLELCGMIGHRDGGLVERVFEPAIAG